jgi:hypothetical protein
MDDESAVVPTSAAAATPTVTVTRKRSRTPNASPRTTLTMYSSKWAQLNKKWWQTNERVTDGPNAGMISAKHAVTCTDIKRGIDIGLNHFELERCDRDRYK